MDAGDLISAASALVAAAAAGVGWWQAHSARRAVKAAEDQGIAMRDQVKAAEDQANAMRDQVKAAEDQVNVMRDQLALERSLRDDGIRPRFGVTHAATMLLPSGEGRLTIDVAQTTGVPLDDVKVELYVGSRQIMTDESHDSVRTPLYSAPGSKITFRAHLDVEAVQAPAVRVELSGTEAQGTRRWAERLIAHPAATDNRLLTDRWGRLGPDSRGQFDRPGPGTAQFPRPELASSASAHAVPPRPTASGGTNGARPVEQDASAPAPTPESNGGSSWRAAKHEGLQEATQLRKPRRGGVTASGLPRRVPKANLVEATERSTPHGGPQVSRAPGDVRNRLSDLRRGVQQGRSAGSEANGEGVGPDGAHDQEHSGVGSDGTMSAEGAPDDIAPGDDGGQDEPSRE